MSNRKLVAIHRIEVADGTEERPKRVNGKVVSDEKGRVITEEVVKTAKIGAGSVFQMDDASQDYKDLVKLGAVKDADEDAKITVTIGAAPDAPAKAKRAPKKPDADDDEGVI